MNSMQNIMSDCLLLNDNCDVIFATGESNTCCVRALLHCILAYITFMVKMHHMIFAMINPQQPPPLPTPTMKTVCISLFTVHHHTGCIAQHRVFFEYPHLAWKRVWKEADRNGTAVLCARIASITAWRADPAVAFSAAKPIALDSLAVAIDIDADRMLAVRFADAPGRKRPASSGLHR